MTGNFAARKVRVNGIVQGVGFRPFVYQLARRHGLRGEVANTPDGVRIHVEGLCRDIDAFRRDLGDHPPPLAQVTEIVDCPDPVDGYTDFSIAASQRHATRSTLISPDVCVCDDCLEELFDPRDRRYRYPFINCTNCGPRYTIIEDIPYDRPATAMQGFTMCRRCQAEYDDPGDRRFHAQPNACADCGPQVALYDRRRRPVAGDAVETAADLLKRGKIVAVKGLGGFHLAADATNAAVVSRLRKRKNRDKKPFALMSYRLADIVRYAVVRAFEQELLTCPQRPIVLLEKRTPNPLCPQVAPGNRYFGVMLPYTPLHYLLLGCGFSALVMTSGNRAHEPLAIENEEAFGRLSDIADYFLVHNRPIIIRSDDSIVRIAAGATRFARRSRGYVPVPLFLKTKVPPILACGGELKNTVCLSMENRAFLSQHIGDLENPAAGRFFENTIAHMQRILDIRPEMIAHDLHPDYLSTRYARQQTDVQKIGVQHHHAHIASCMAENGIDGPVIGLAFDGSGYGGDGRIWGGEVLIVEGHRFRRVAHLAEVALPGGAAAIREPWRMAVSYLYATFGDDLRNLALPVIRKIDSRKIDVIVAMIAKRVNSPLTSSMGRLFDGVAGLLGMRDRVSYEGQAAMELEMLAGSDQAAAYDFEWADGDVRVVALAPLVRQVVRDILTGRPAAEISARFHRTLIELFTALCETIRAESGLKRVVLSGGVFQNVRLLSGFVRILAQKKFDVYTHKKVPANDGGLCLGQLLVAAETAARKRLRCV